MTFTFYVDPETIGERIVIGVGTNQDGDERTALAVPTDPSAPHSGVHLTITEAKALRRALDGCIEAMELDAEAGEIR